MRIKFWANNIIESDLEVFLVLFYLTLAVGFICLVPRGGYRFPSIKLI